MSRTANQYGKGARGDRRCATIARQRVFTARQGRYSGNRGADALGAVQGAMAFPRLDWAAWAVWQVRPGARLEFQAAREWWAGRSCFRDLLSCMKHPRRLFLPMVDKPRALFTIAPMNENAQALGRLAKGKPKTLTTEQRKASADRMRAAQKLRWKDKARQGVA